MKIGSKGEMKRLLCLTLISYQEELLICKYCGLHKRRIAAKKLLQKLNPGTSGK
jgi:hypothetical protein